MGREGVGGEEWVKVEGVRAAPPTPYQAAMAAVATAAPFHLPCGCFLFPHSFSPPSLSLPLSVCESKILKIDFDFRFVPNKSRGETSDSPKSGKLY